jgi:hypothetical protein
MNRIWIVTNDQNKILGVYSSREYVIGSIMAKVVNQFDNRITWDNGLTARLYPILEFIRNVESPTRSISGG